MSINHAAGAGAELGIAPFTNLDVLGCAIGNAYRGAFPLGELVAKQPDTDGLGKNGSAHLDASTRARSEEFTRLITAQRNRSASSKIIATPDQCLKN